ncbi:MAG: hypothetical protein KDI63_03560 [Gammaproteobacteria bacterium]|nr:hypothetical protein [Gammaproteobacteria bacterium]
MAYFGESRSIIQAHRLELSEAFAKNGNCILPERAVQILHDYLDYLEQAFTTDSRKIDIGEIQEMLLEVACIIRSSNASIHAEEHKRLLERLIAIYSKGLVHEENERFSITAPDYADVVEAISINHPGYDYSEAVGQLLYYLNLLYRHRKGSWKTVYDHILSMPNSILSIKNLKDSHLQKIHRWVEEGVQNLFEIRRDLRHRIDELGASVSKLSLQIEREEAGIAEESRSWCLQGLCNIASLDLERKKRAVAILHGKRNQLLDQQHDKRQIANLIELNISEFENSLKEARRAFFMRQLRQLNPLTTSTNILPAQA